MVALPLYQLIIIHKSYFRTKIIDISINSNLSCEILLIYREFNDDNQQYSHKKILTPFLKKITANNIQANIRARATRYGNSDGHLVLS